jgi:hypothetical protein
MRLNDYYEILKKKETLFLFKKDAKILKENLNCPSMGR